MPPSGRHSRRLALAGVIAALAASALVILSPDSDQGGGAVRGDEAAGSEAPRAGELIAEAPARGPAAEEVARSQAQPEEGLAEGIDPAAFPGGPGEEPVLVTVHLSTVADEVGHPPDGCEGWPVVAQTWLRETEEVFRHVSHADARGVAEFRFPGSVHVDWVRCSPPPDSGLAVVFEEDHVDVRAGGRHRWILAMETGGAATGRVVDLDGAPVQGAVVHGFSGAWTYGLGNWTPGIVTTESGADGRFRFPSLEPGRWVFAVQPGPWLQLEPSLGHGAAAIAAGEETDYGERRVAAFATARMRVLDSRGHPVSGVQVVAQPLQIDDPRLFVDPRQAEAHFRPRLYNRSYHEFLDGLDPGELGTARPREAGAAGATGGGREGMAWPYGGATVITDGAGHAEIRGVAGNWHVQVENPDGFGRERIFAPLELRLPSGTHVMRLPGPLHALEGVVLSERERRPLDDVRLMLHYRLNGEEHRMGRQTGADGRFRFDGVPTATAYRLQALRARGHVPHEWEVPLQALQSDVPREYLLEPEVAMLVTVRDGDGAAMKNVRFELLEWTPAGPGDAGAEARGLWWDRARAGAGRMRTDSGGTAVLHGMRPGIARLRLKVATGTGRWQPNGSAVTATLTLGEFAVPVDGEQQFLTVDASGWMPPAPRLGRIVGEVLDARSGEPIAGAAVSLSAQGYARSARTGSRGKCSLRGGPGTVTISAHAEGYRPARSSATIRHEQETPVVLRLEPGASAASLLLRGRDGGQLPPLQVQAFDERGMPLRLREHGRSTALRSSFHVNDGALRLLDLPPGEVHLRVRCWGEVVGTVQVRGRIVAGPVRGVEDLPPLEEVRLERSVDELRAALRAREDG